MNKRFVKYLMCLIFVFTQVQIFANQTKKDNSWSRLITPSVIESYDFLPEAFKLDKINFNSSVLDEGVYFTLKGEVIGGICYNSNSNPKYIKYTLKNISNSTISLNTSTNYRLQLSGEGLDLSDIKYEDNSSVDLTYFNYIQGNIVINPGASLIFKVKVNSNTTTNVVKTSLKVVYGTAATFILDTNKVQELEISNNIFKSNLTSLPTISSGKLNPYGANTLQNSLALSDQEVELLKFYKNGIEVSPQTIIDINNSTGFQYSTPCSGENVRGAIQFTVLDYSDLPSPGSIGGNPSQVCYGGSVTINNITSGEGSYLTSLHIGRYALKYSWEISYNNGTTWVASDDSQDTDGYQSITINDVMSDILVRRKAHERPVGSRKINYAYSNVISISVLQNNIIFPNDKNTFAVEEGGTFNFPAISTSLPSNIEVYNTSGVVVYKKEGNTVTVNTPLTDLAKGTHNYTVKATTITGAPVVGCETYSSITVTVYNLADCNVVKVKQFATHYKSWTSGASGVANPEKAVNGDRSQYATLTGGVVLLGIGTVGIDLYFTKPDPTDPTKRIMVNSEDMKGKKVTIKLGEQYSGVKIAGGLTVRAINTGQPLNDLSSVPSLIGATYGVKGGVLDLLKGDNVFEFTVTPAKTNGELVPFNGVRIQLGSLIGVADLATVFHAYVEDEYRINPDSNSCTVQPIQVTPANSYPTEQKGKIVSNNPITLNQFIDDATWGNYTEVLNVASGLSSVAFPYYAIDDSYDSYSIFNTTAGVLNKQFLNAKLRQLARPGDQVQITLGTENVNVLNLGLLSLSPFRIKYFLGDTQVGEEQLDRFRILDLGLLNFSNEKKIVLSSPITVPFDRIQLEQWNTINVNLGNQMYIFDIRINPQMLFDGQTDTKNITTLCAAEFLKINRMDVCTSYEVSFAHVTEYGDQLIDENGNLMVDADGNPIRSVKAVEDIPNSFLELDHYADHIDYFEIAKLYPEYGNNLLVKIQTKRQGCNYGDPQYLRVKLINCNAAIVNPVIKSGPY